MATRKQELSEVLLNLSWEDVEKSYRKWLLVGCDCGHTRRSHLHHVKSPAGEYILTTCKGLDCYCASFEEEVTICPECLRSNLNDDKTLCWDCQGV